MSSAFKSIKPFGFPWPPQYPFLFCVHLEDFYPNGNDVMIQSTHCMVEK